MRLICPNCGAQYEVPDDVIPTAGRDVQCSNCGHTWFEQPGASEAAEDDGFFADTPSAAEPVAEDAERSEFGAPMSEPQVTPEDPDKAPPEPQAAQDGNADPDAEQEVGPDGEQEVGPEVGPEEDLIEQAVATAIRSETAPGQPAAGPAQPPSAQPPSAQPSSAPRRRGIDPAVAEILRKEAEREGAAPRAADPLESQPDLGITDAASEQRDEESRRRMARMRGESAPTTAATMADPGNRRELLPDIEEINSSLRPKSDLNPEHGTGEGPAPRRGFRSGFFAVILLAAGLAAVYSYAPNIEAAVPQAKPYLDSYVAQVDDLRLWLDQQMRLIIEKMGPTADAT